MQWITRERSKIDRIACPWLVARFIDEDADLLDVPIDEVLEIAGNTGATPYDVPGVELWHHTDQCSFDAFLLRYHLDDGAVHKLTPIVRGADCRQLHLAPEAAGLFVISKGLSLSFRDDREMLMHGMVLYDALYTWCRQ